ncbi:AraC family transcriptional regulator [Rhizobium sp. LjRoot254]|uniref:helix-turn-helix transcriptional regulator n=1 Tax=Rhizobium sp. LjRoot254 TaxID=3342297 RepID=UPI003ECFA48D
MTRELGQAGPRGLERLCEDASGDHIIHDAGISGLERIDVSISRYTYEPHRHDTYGIGVTLEGVQTFNYRGARRISTSGKCIILHPDEVHDGAAGDETGLHYRMFYLDPALLGAALAPLGETLPFVSTPVIEDAELQQLSLSVLDMNDTEFSSLQVDGFVAELAPILLRLAHCRSPKTSAAPAKHLHAVRDYLDANRFDQVSSGELEDVAGLDRFTIARQFRRQFGTSPHRYLLMRRLASARERISLGQPLADIAADTGFADQAHFSRHFKKAYGMTPGRWAMLAAGGVVRERA